MKDENIIKRSSDYCLKILEICDLESSNLRLENVLICVLYVCRIELVLFIFYLFYLEYYFCTDVSSRVKVNKRCCCCCCCYW